MKIPESLLIIYTNGQKSDISFSFGKRFKETKIMDNEEVEIIVNDDGEIEIVDENLIRHEEDYKKETQRLLELIEQREELVGLLKIAKPEKIAHIREGISHYDRSIESLEKFIAIIEQLIQTRLDYIENVKELYIMGEKIEQGMREHFADQPEKLALLEAMLEDDGKSH